MTDKKSDKPDDKSDDKHRTEQQKILQEKPFDYIERTRPEDRIDGDIDERAGRGQLTRDNVNPAIPSAKPGESGGIVDPKRLGMEGQAGEPPPAREDLPPARKDEKGEEKQELVSPRVMSINEPPGSNVLSKSLPPDTPRPGNELPPPPARAAPGRSNDPDDIEAELEDAEDDGDVVKSGSKKKK